MSDFISTLILVIIIVIIVVIIFNFIRSGGKPDIFTFICIGLLLIFVIVGLITILTSPTNTQQTAVPMIPQEISTFSEGKSEQPHARRFSRATCCASKASPSSATARPSAIATEIYPCTPQQVGSVYLGSGSVSFDGTGKKIGIIGCFYYPQIQADFNVFCNEFGLKSKQLQVYKYGTATDSGWATELCLDVQWSNVFAPNATTYVFMAQDDSFSSILYAIQQAVAAKCDIISMSFGSDENTAIIEQLEPVFVSNPNILFLASSGDSDTVAYPSSSPNVISVGGTILTIGSNGVNESRGPTVNKTAITPGTYTKLAESDWYTPDGSGSGHGTSAFFAKPAYQTAHNPSQYRSTPDLSLIAATPGDAGVFIYCSVAGGWFGVEGTSLSSPIFAGILATVNSRRKNPLIRTQILTYLYSLASALLPIDIMVDGAGYINGRIIQTLVSI